MRPPRPDEVDAIAALLVTCELHDVGPEHADTFDSIRADVLASWARTGFDRERDAWVAEEDGTLVAYGEVYVRPNREAVIGSYVRPDRRGHGLGTALMDAIEARAADAKLLTAYVSGSNPEAEALLRARGFQPGKRTWQMTIDLDEPPPRPAWPEDVSVRTFEPGRDDRALYELIEAAFADTSPDRERVPFEEWAGYMLRDDADPSLYFLAERDGELVGAVLCPPYEDIGWIRQIGVRRDQRGQGLGRALLLHAFGALYDRGRRRIGLGLDEWNETGARQLYERAGMRRALEHRRYHRVTGR